MSACLDVPARLAAFAALFNAQNWTGLQTLYQPGSMMAT